MKTKTLNEKTAKMLAKVATKKLGMEANSVSCVLAYQPKEPKELNRFKKK